MASELDVETNTPPSFWSNLGKAMGSVKWTPAKIVAITIAVTIFAIVSASLLGESFQYIEWDEYALKKNTASNDVDYTHVHGSGRYFWGINFKAITFKKTVRNVNFDDDNGGQGSLTIFTDTGLQIKILCSFQYQLIKEQIPSMFVSFGTTYDQQVVSVARSIMKNTAPQFPVEQYYQQRENVTNTFFNALKPSLESLAQVTLVSFQLRYIYLADQLVQKLLNIQVQLQENIRQEYVQQATIIRKETDSQVASIEANATFTLSQAQSQADAIRSKANANAFQTRETARKDGLSTLFQTLNFTTAQQKLSYVYTTGIASTSARLLVDTKGALISINDANRK